MAYPLFVGDIVEVTIRSTVNAQTCLSLFHYRFDGSGTVPDGGGAILQFLNVLNGGAGLVAKYAALMGSNCPINELRGQMIRSSRWNPISVAPITPAGTWDGDGVSNPSVAVAFTKRAEAATRSGRGTLHMPGVPEDAMVGGKISNGYRDAADPLEAQIAAVVTPSSGRVWTPIIYNRTNPANSQVIVSVSTEENLRTMRRRVVGRGI